MPIVSATDFTFPLRKIEKRIVRSISECWRNSTHLRDMLPWSAEHMTIPHYLMAPNPAQVTFEIESIG